jgi:hypothetical protein
MGLHQLLSWTRFSIELYDTVLILFRICKYYNFSVNVSKRKTSGFVASHMRFKMRHLEERGIRFEDT